MVDRNRLIKDFTDLAAIDSLSFHEGKIAAELIKKLEELGIAAKTDNANDIYGSEVGNVYAVWEGEALSSPILLSAHLDTVAPGIGKKIIVDEDEGIIRTDGSTVLGSDDVAGIVEILEGIRLVKESGQPHRTVELLFPIAEEVYTKGATVFDYSKFESKEAYCLDLSGNIGTAATKSVSLISFEVVVNGKASHAGFAPSDGINAIAIAAKAIAKIKQGQVDLDSTLNIGTIEGGTATNIISDKVTVRGELRSYLHDRAIELLEGVRKAFEDEVTLNKASIDFKYDIHLKAYEIDENEQVLKRFDRAVNELGIEPKHISTYGGADNHQFNANGIKGIVVSCGMTDVHTTLETVQIDDLVNGAKLVSALILN